MENKKLEEVISYLSNFNKQIGKTLVILGFDSTKSGYLIVQDNYGLLSVAKRNLKDGCTPTITSAIDKEEYFGNKLISKNESYRKGVFAIVKFDTKKVLCKDKYEFMLVDSNDLLRGHTCGIKSAINKNTYFLNKLIDYNSYFKNGEFKVVSDYKSKEHGKITIDTLCCGLQYVRADSLLSNYKPAVYDKYSKIQENKYKTYFYVLRLYDENENFYKIGVTDCVENRVKNYSSVYSVEKIYAESNLHSKTFAYDMEQKILKEFINFKYMPKKYFSGYTECLIIDPIPNCYN